MSAGRPKERPRMMGSHESSSTKTLAMASSSAVARPGAFTGSYHGEAFAQQPYNVMQSKPIGMPYDLTQSADTRLGQDMYEHGRRLTAPPPGQPYPQPPRQMDRLDVHQPRKRPQHGPPFTEKVDLSPEKHNISLRPPPVETAMIAPVPKKARLQGNPRFSGSGAPLNYPLRIDTALDTSKIKMEPPGGYHPETEAISPTLPTESHDSKSDIVHSINEVDREINQIENQIQQLQKKQFKLEAEAAKPKEDILEDDWMESKPLSIAQIVYKENRKLAHQSHSSLSKMKYTSSSCSDLPLFHQPCDTQVYHENVRKFVTFKAVLQSYFKKKALERDRTEKYWVDNYEHLITSWLKKVDAKTLKKNIKDIKTREYYEKTFPDIKKHREDKERITSRVGARGVSSGYARTEAEFEQIIDGITEQEEEDKKMKAYAVIPPMLNQTQRKLRFINRNGLIQEPMSEYKERKQTTSWSTEEKEVFKEKYLERPKQFGQIADLLPNKTLNDCVLYYYMSKKTENYKQLLKKQAKRPPRRPHMKSIIRNSNEGQLNTSDSTSNAKGCDSEELVRVIRPAEGDSKQNCCAACGVKLESYSVSHNVTVNTCTQFGLDPHNYQPSWRVCATCVKLKRRKTKVCPIPSCTWPHKRVRHLPLHWDQIPSHIKDKIMKELQMEEEVKRCCSACYDKIADLLLDEDNDTDEPTNEGGFTTKWSVDDTNTFKKAVCLYGKKWAMVASMVVGKSEGQCRMYFYRNKKKLGLDAIYCDYRKHRAEQGLELEPSDDSVDEDDDDNLEDNDISSDDDVSVAVKFPPSTVISSSSNTSTNSPSVASVKMEVSAECESKSGGCERSDTTLPAVKSSSAVDSKPVVKMETAEQAQPLIKSEKMDHDSSATASADEEPSADQSFLGVTQVEKANPYSKAISFIKREPGLMANPDGMLAFTTSSQALCTSSSALISQPPPSSQSNAPATSVKDLIDLAIEDALGTASANDTGGVQRQSVINQCPPPASAPSDIPQRNGYQQDMRMDTHSQRHANSSGAGARPDDASMRRAPLLPYEGDPRAYVQVLQEKHSSSPHPFAGKMAVESGQVRAPPPAHSHHHNSAPLDKRSADRKSPAATPFAIYDKSNNGDSRMNMSPHGRSTIGQPPPLISSGVPHLPSHLQQHIKKESHAGGSILQGTSAGHSHQPPTSRFEAGSISHGTPRNQSEVKAPSQASRSDEKMARSPRPQSALHSPAVPAVPNHSQSFERHLEQQQMRLIQDALRRGVIPGTGIHYPPAMFDPYQTKSVLQTDFQTAKQMSNSSVNHQAAASAYTSALEKEKGGKASPHPLDPVRLGFPPYMFDQQARALMMMGMMAPRMITPEQQRFFTPPAATTISTPPMSREDIKSWSFVSRPQPPQAARPELSGPAKPSITQGLIPKTVEMLQRPPDANRRSASPHIKKDSKTRYEKEVEEVKFRSQSERKRPDGEGDNSQLSAAYPGNNRLSDFYGVPRSPSMGSQSDLGPGGYNSKSQAAYRPSIMAGSKANDLARDMKKEKPSTDYRDRLANQYQRSAYSSNRIEESVQNCLAAREERKMYLEHDQKAAMHHAHKMEAGRRHDANESENCHRPTDMSRPATSKSSVDDAFVSKKLAEVSKGLQKDVLLKDGSALFSSSFEKDQMPQNVSSTKYSGEETKPGLTTANLIDAIIMQQINRENTAENSGKGTPSHQHTSVIVKQQRPIQHSRSDTDISSYSMHERVSGGGGSEPPSAAPLSSSSNAGPVKPGASITLADKINEIITNDYNNKGAEPSESQLPAQKMDRPASNSSALPYRVEDIEPISPPGANCQSNNKPSKPLPVTNKKHAGIRSLLGADNSNSTESVSKSVESSAPVSTAGMSLLDVFKSNIEDAVRYESASAAANSQHRPVYAGQSQHYPKQDERLGDTGARAEPGGKKRFLNTMLAPNNKRLALSPRQAKSPEEVEMYTSSSSAASTHGSNAIYRPPPMASFTNSSMYRSAGSGHYQPSNHPFNPPNSLSKSHMTNSSPVKTSVSAMSHPSLSQSYHQERMASMNHSGYSERPLSAGQAEDLTREDNFNTRHGANQPSPIRSSMRSPGVASSSNNRMSPVVGYHSSSNSRVSPIAAASPLAAGQARKSPITGNSKISPGMYATSQTGGSRPSSRQSPSLSNRHSPIASRQSPMEASVKSPLTSTESPTSRVNHINSDLSRHAGSLNENHLSSAINPKMLEAARSLHSLGTLHVQPRPLLSERYETLSDDERS